MDSVLSNKFFKLEENIKKNITKIKVACKSVDDSLRNFTKEIDLPENSFEFSDDDDTSTNNIQNENAMYQANSGVFNKKELLLEILVVLLSVVLISVVTHLLLPVDIEEIDIQVNNKEDVLHTDNLTVENKYVSRIIKQQFHETIQQMNSALRTTIDPNSLQSVSIAVLIPQNTPEGYEVIFIKNLVSNWERISIQELDLDKYSKGTTLETDIESFLKVSRVLLIKNIIKANSKTLLDQFHKYCDNNVAPHKNAVFIFPLRVPLNTVLETDWLPIKSRNIANKILVEAWKDVVDEDYLQAIVGRLTYIAVLLNEDPNIP